MFEGGEYMKKRMLVVFLMLCMMAYYGGYNLMARTETPQEIVIYVNGEKVDTEVSPILKNNRTLIPLRSVFEKLGAEVDFNQTTNQAIIQTDSNEILLELGNSAVLVNGRIQFMDTQSLAIDGRTFVPLRFVAEQLGASVQWDGVKKRIDIRTANSTIVNEAEELPTVDNLNSLVQLLNYNDELYHYYYLEDSIDINFAQDVVVEEQVDSSMISEEATRDTDYSETNTQVEGVDEGDIIKTDGQYIFYTALNKVYIVEADPFNPKVKATISTDIYRGRINEIYVTDKKLIIVGDTYTSYKYPENITTTHNQMNKGLPYYQTNNTALLVYDYSEVENPKRVMDMDFEGKYISSRMVNNQLYMVSGKDIYIDKNMSNKDDLEGLKKEYEILPKYSNNLTNEVSVVGYDHIQYFPDYVDSGIFMTIGIDLTTDNVSVSSYVGKAETIYATAKDLYLGFTHYNYTDEGNGLIYRPVYEVSTSIYRFSMEDGRINYDTAGSVKGSVLNRFSMDEHDGYLRIGTTSGSRWSRKDPQQNHVYILDGDLRQVSSLENLAENERIYSMRFNGSRIYMVTYRETDPFFVIDASNPYEPILLGTLKVPGFSTYMHILDENHILGFGTETVEKNGSIQQSGFKLSLFDVSDPKRPIEKKKEVIGNGGTYSELSQNHKALMVSLEKGIMGFPITVSENGDYTTDFDGAYVYRINSDDFSYMGRITHQQDEIQLYNGYTIDRLLYIGDYIYSFSEKILKVTEIDTMETRGILELPLVKEPIQYQMDVEE